MYKHIYDNIDNGLIVNYTTHEPITKMGINDEEKLRELCIEQNWCLEWYDIFLENMKSYIKIESSN